jgi:hypothetical protein
VICPGPADGFLKLVNIVHAHGQTTYVYQVHKAVLLPTNLSLKKCIGRNDSNSGASTIVTLQP